MAERRRERLRRLARHPLAWLGLVLIALVSAGAALAGCTSWDPSRPFERNAPDVDRALALLESGDLTSAQEVLETYLGTGPCSAEGFGRSDRMVEKSDASFDLALVLFAIAEQFGHPFGQEEAEAKPDQEALDGERKIRVDCALIAARAIGNDEKVPIELRARALYLAGNLQFLRKEYEAAVVAYDGALLLVPGIDEEAEGDRIGVDAAYNRAIALRRLQEEKEQEQDEEDDEQNDDQQDQEEQDEQEPEPDEKDQDEQDQDEQDPNEQEQDPNEQEQDPNEQEQDPNEQEQDPSEPDPRGDEEKEGGDEPQDPPAEPPPELDDPDEDDGPPPPSGSHIDRMLDDLENAPTYQEQEAKRRQGQRPVMEDK